jgi:UDP-N-acetylglucosamine/UDP-N-acetylgalactosamine diphosphorylase
MAFYDELDAQQKENLLSQIDKLDFDRIGGWIDEYVKNDRPMEVPAEFSPAPSFAPVAGSDQQQETYRKACDIGIELISSGKVAGFVVAGGQGTRLGFDGPKGNFPISPIKNKTLFQIFAEGVLAASKKYQATIPWYVMTSPLNHKVTVEIFESAGYYGLNKQDVIIFQQGTMPNFAFDGKIFLAEKGKLATSPDGHGGSLKALKDSGALDDMKKRGIEQISYWQVDNPLINVCDPLFIGLHAMENAGMSSKALKKVDPLEKVGNFCMVDGKVAVIEYSDLPDEYAHQTEADGSLTFELGSIGIHVISTSFVEEINKGVFSLPFHRAIKKIPHIDPQGNFIKPDEPNGVKLETFIFEAIPLADRSIVLQTLRSEEFAPVKNATGTDSAEVTRTMMIERAAKWLESAGVEIPRTDEGKPDCTIEISPAFALCAEDIAVKLGQIPPIASGSKIYLD